MRFFSALKRFVKSHIFRVIIGAVIIFSTVFFPMYYLYPTIDHVETQRVLIVVIIFAAAFETVVFLVISHFLVYGRLSSANKKLKKLSNNDSYDVKENSASVDNTVTELVDSINSAAEEYKRLEQGRKQFVANASHELRSPLTSVQGFLQAVLDGTATEEDKEKYLKIALSETKRLNSLINSMLDLSRLESGKNPLVYTKFNINDIISEVAVRFEPALIKKVLQINVDFAREICYVYADKDKIIQVINNLVDNAIKYSPSYSRILLTTSIHANKVYVKVKDFGYGISKKDQMLVWDTFYMTDKSRSPVKAKGSGLGLSIVKKIIDEHGEVIWIESSRGAGATFIFTLTLFDENRHKSNKGTIIKSESAADGPINKAGEG